MCVHLKTDDGDSRTEVEWQWESFLLDASYQGWQHHDLPYYCASHGAFRMSQEDVPLFTEALERAARFYFEESQAALDAFDDAAGLYREVCAINSFLRWLSGRPFTIYPVVFATNLVPIAVEGKKRDRPRAEKSRG